MSDDAVTLSAAQLDALGQKLEAFGATLDPTELALLTAVVQEGVRALNDDVDGFLLPAVRPGLERQGDGSVRILIGLNQPAAQGSFPGLGGMVKSFSGGV